MTVKQILDRMDLVVFREKVANLVVDPNKQVPYNTCKAFIELMEPWIKGIFSDDPQPNTPSRTYQFSAAVLIAATYLNGLP